MRIDQAGTTLDAASREAAARSSAEAALPITDAHAVSRSIGPSGARMPGSPDASEYNPAYGMVDEDGNAYIFWNLGVTKFSDIWRFGPPSP